MKQKTNSAINVKLSKKAITDGFLEAALSTYGIMDIAHSLDKKGKKVNKINVHIHSDETISVSAYLVVAKDLKITEILRSCQKTCRTYLEHLYPKHVRDINLYAESLSD